MTTSNTAGSDRLQSSPYVPCVLPVAVSAIIWVVVALAVPPAHQDFPLVDDWAFGGGALALAGGQGVQYFGWAAMPLWGQWLWAQPFIWALGPTFWALRCSTIVLGWLAIWAVDDLFRTEKVPTPQAALAAAALAACPLFVLLQGTFMSDVPALSFSLVALALYVRALRSRRKLTLVLAALGATLATTTRQNASVTSLTAAIMLWRDRDLRRSVIWWTGVLLPLAAGAAAHLWLQARPDVTPSEIAPPPPDVVVLLPYLIVHLFGIVALPLLLLNPRRFRRRAYWLALSIMLAWAYYWSRWPQYFLYRGFFPYVETMVTIFGAFSGELTVGQRPVLLDMNWRIILTLLGCAGGAAWLVSLWDWCKRSIALPPIVIFAILHMPFILIAPELWDRYLLVLIPAGLFLAASPGPVPRWSWLPARGVTVLMGLISIGLLHDWLAWNDARWTLGRRAMHRDRIAASDIEGGFEWDGWHARDDLRPFRSVNDLLGFRGVKTMRGLALQSTQKWFPQVTGRYALSFTETPGLRTVDREPYVTWLPYGKHEFFLIKSRTDHSE